MDEDFLDVTNHGNKSIAIILILIITLLGVFGYFFVYEKYHFTPKTVKLELNSSISNDVNDYLKRKVVDKTGYSLDTSKIDINTIGEYTYTIKYNKITKKGKAIVADTTAPIFETKDLTIQVDDEDFYLGDVLTKCEDASKPCIVTFKNKNDEKKIKKAGTYNIDIYVSDTYNNKKEATVKITVTDDENFVREEEKDLELARTEKELEDFDNKFYVKLDKALKESNELVFEIKARITLNDINAIIESDYPDYTIKNVEIINAYNKSGYVIGFIVRATISNGEDKVIYIEKNEDYSDEEETE